MAVPLEEKKRMANHLSGMAGGADIYEIQKASSGTAMPTNGDEYYGMPAMTAIRSVLEARKAAGLGPAMLSEIFDTLVAGGYQFEAASDSNAKNSLRVTLAKRSSTFHRLPNGKYGLLKWYGKIKGGKKGLKPEADDDAKGLQKMEDEFGEAEAEAPLENA